LVSLKHSQHSKLVEKTDRCQKVIGVIWKHWDLNQCGA
jgi:hypothetical protein